MLKITTVREDEKAARLKVDGKIVDPYLLDLENICTHYLKVEAKEVILDFEGVDFIEDEGIAMLQKFNDKRVIILNSSLFIKSLLNLNEISNVG